jgi:hypothetical protein
MKKIIQVQTGEIIEPAFVRGNHFWRSFELKNDGTPDARKRGRQIGITPSTGEYYYGRWAELCPEREKLAAPIREEIEALAKRESALRDALNELYCERKPQ